jgi:Mce-associated membrane protein
VPNDSDIGTDKGAALCSEKTAAQLEPEKGKPDDSDGAADPSTSGGTGQKVLVSNAEDSRSGDVRGEDTKTIKLLTFWRRIKWTHVFAFAVLPILGWAIAATAGFLKWQDAWNRNSALAAQESVAAAKDSTVALLSYQPDTVEKDLGAARDRLTGKFKDSYTQLVHDVVIPGAKKDRISAVATVPAAAVVSATPSHAVVLVFVDQTVTVGNDAPTETASTVRVSMDKGGERWLISGFDPV